jgi:hypothetical protein
MATDITDLMYQGNKLYLSPIDSYNQEIVSYEASMEGPVFLQVVNRSLKKAFKKIPNNTIASILDQGTGNTR